MQQSELVSLAVLKAAIGSWCLKHQIFDVASRQVEIDIGRLWLYLDSNSEPAAFGGGSQSQSWSGVPTQQGQ